VSHRYNVYPFARRIHLPGRHNGLVQPLCSVVGSIGEPGFQLLCFGSELGFVTRPARDLQLGSGCAVHFGDLHETP